MRWNTVQAWIRCIRSLLSSSTLCYSAFSVCIWDRTPWSVSSSHHDPIRFHSVRSHDVSFSMRNQNWGPPQSQPYIHSLTCFAICVSNTSENSFLPNNWVNVSKDIELICAFPMKFRIHALQNRQGMDYMHIRYRK